MSRFALWNLAKLLLIALAIGSTVGLSANLEAQRRAEVQAYTIQAESEIVYRPFICPAIPAGYEPPAGFTVVTTSCGVTR